MVQKSSGHQLRLVGLKKPVICRVFFTSQVVFSPDFWTINSLWWVFVACEAAIVWQSWISGGTMARSESIWWMPWFCWLFWLLTICTCDMRMRFVADVSMVQQKIESTGPQESLQILSGLGLGLGVLFMLLSSDGQNVPCLTPLAAGSPQLESTPCHSAEPCHVKPSSPGVRKLYQYDEYRWVRPQANLPITYLWLEVESPYRPYIFSRWPKTIPSSVAKDSISIGRGWGPAAGKLPIQNVYLYYVYIARWWQLNFLNFQPYLGKRSNLTKVFKWVGCTKPPFLLINIDSMYLPED